MVNGKDNNLLDLHYNFFYQLCLGKTRASILELMVGVCKEEKRQVAKRRECVDEFNRIMSG